MNDQAKTNASVDLLTEAIKRTLVEFARRLGAPLSEQELLEASTTLLGAIVGQQLYSRGWGEQSPLTSVEIYERQGQERIH